MHPTVPPPPADVVAALRQGFMAMARDEALLADAEGAVGRRKARRFDDVRRDAEAGAQPENRSGIRRDIGLVEGDPNHGAATAAGSLAGGLEPQKCGPK